MGAGVSQTIICIKWGTRYGPEYVNRLSSMVRRRLFGQQLWGHAGASENKLRTPGSGGMNSAKGEATSTALEHW